MQYLCNSAGLAQRKQCATIAAISRSYSRKPIVRYTMADRILEQLKAKQAANTTLELSRKQAIRKRRKSSETVATIAQVMPQLETDPAASIMQIVEADAPVQDAQLTAETVYSLIETSDRSLTEPSLAIPVLLESLRQGDSPEIASQTAGISPADLAQLCSSQPGTLKRLQEAATIERDMRIAVFVEQCEVMPPVAAAANAQLKWSFVRAQLESNSVLREAVHAQRMCSLSAAMRQVSNKAAKGDRWALQTQLNQFAHYLNPAAEPDSS